MARGVFVVAHGWGGGLISVFEEFSAIVGKAFVLAGGWAMGYHLLGFRKFPDISLFHGILSLFFFLCGHTGPPSGENPKSWDTKS